ncbi:DUF4142 domain-containing protein [Planctomicrobium piriforme]|uniref:DUF4142 domain-containing protein n=1 Tax=Planctomicrobium piriforme TaxID=1576369 RepID=A0A1I3J7H7_9PLAN|nr:DUF4142 domain-containing protein [Planctomicrobium piriforme]SFI56301.1 protein of unknown function [Planctomicrobium piriforme]
MLKKLSLPAVVAMSVAGVAFAEPPVQAPREVNQEKSFKVEEQQVHQRANSGQQTGQPVRTQTTVPSQNAQPGVVVTDRQDAQHQGEHLNQHVADCLLLHNQEEINLAKYASEQSKDQRTKDFAAMLIRDHEAWGQKLTQFAGHDHSAAARATTSVQGQQALPVQTPADRRETREELREQGVTNRQARDVVREARDANGKVITGERVEHRAAYAGSAAGDQMYQIARDAVNNCEKLTRAQLSKEQGADFDKAFVGMQIGAHIGMLAQLQAVEPHVTGDLQQVVRDGITATQQHMAKAESLMKELKTEQKR